MLIQKTFFRCVLLVLIALGASATNTQAEQQALQVGVDVTAYPVAFRQDGEVRGLAVDIVQALGDRLGFDTELVVHGADDLHDQLRAGQVDTYIQLEQLYQSRPPDFAYSQPYLYSGAQLVVRRGDDRIGSVRDIPGAKVAVEAGSSFYQALQQVPFAEASEILSDDHRIAELTATGRADAFVTGRIEALLLIRDKPLPLQLAGKPFLPAETAFPFLPTESGLDLRNQLDDALTEMKLDGTLGRISRQWLGADITQP